MQIQFPSSFLWGASLSSYQCEGNNTNTDWFSWEKEKGLTACGRACDHYSLFEQDFTLASQLNLNALRLSVEWARIAPQINVFADDEIVHYVRVADALLSRKIKPTVTLHHFTNPLWFIQKGGWLRAENIDFFIAYLIRVVESLKDRVDTWFILNEPFVYIYNGFIEGIWPPGIQSLKQAKIALDNMLCAYCIGVKEIKRIYSGSSLSPRVSLTKNMRLFSGCPASHRGLNALSAGIRSKIFNFAVIERLHRKKALDFLGIQYYSREYSKWQGFLGTECACTDHPERKNMLGWNVYPKGLYDILMRCKQFGLPVIITENGTADREPAQYEDFLLTHLQSLAEAQRDGVPIEGYFWWSLLDNFEWDKGFGPRFGLLEVDYVNMSRTVKPFAHTYAKICKENAVEIPEEKF